MKVTICISSYCHVKGAPQVIAELQRLVEEAGVKDYVELAGKFCMKRCQEGNAQGVNIDIDGSALRSQARECGELLPARDSSPGQGIMRSSRTP